MEKQLTALEKARQWKENSPQSLAIEEKHEGEVPLYSHEEMIETLAAYAADPPEGGEGPYYSAKALACRLAAKTESTDWMDLTAEQRDYWLIVATVAIDWFGVASLPSAAHPSQEQGAPTQGTCDERKHRDLGLHPEIGPEAHFPCLNWRATAAPAKQPESAAPEAQGVLHMGVSVIVPLKRYKDLVSQSEIIRLQTSRMADTEDFLVEIAKIAGINSDLFEQDELLSALKDKLAAHPPAVPRCPKCQSKNIDVTYSSDDYALAQCRECQHQLGGKLVAQFFTRQDSPQASATAQEEK